MSKSIVQYIRLTLMLIAITFVGVAMTSCDPEEYEAFWDGYNFVTTGDSSVFDD